MKKPYFILLVLSLFLSSCSIFTEDDEEPMLFLDTHNMSVWERTDSSNKGVQKLYMRILSNPKKIAERWYSNFPDHVCYSKDLYGNGFDVSIDSNTEDHLEFEQKNAKDMNQDQISLDIRNDTLIQIGYTGNAHGYYNWARTWVKSEVNVDNLKMCD